MRAEKILGGRVHFAKGNRDFSKSAIFFRALCSEPKFIESSLNSATYSLENITCPECLEEFIRLKEKELLKAKEFLKYIKRK